MPDSRDFDVQWLSNLRLPYDVVTKQLSDQEPRFVETASNIYVTLGGKIALAPGFNQTPSSKALAPFALVNTSFRPDRLVVYETLETPVKVYLISSQFNIATGFWEAYYLRIDAASPAWTKVDGGANLRSVQQSTRPHEIVSERGLCWIKGFPQSSGDKYGTVVFDGSIPNPGSNTVPSIYPWGVLAPTQTGLLSPPFSSWPASGIAFTVVYGWIYTYCYKDLLGNYSCHAPVAPLPNGSGGNTGPFTSQQPQFVVAGQADTVNIPKIGIFRTTDGGGTFYFVKDITNVGAGNITFTDNSAGGTTPLQDYQLNTFIVAPDLVTNLPPPPIAGAVGEVTGTTQVDPSTSIVPFARRLWYGSGNRLFFSGQEEVLNGVPEECWPNCNGFGPATQYICESQVRQVIPAKTTLWITTGNGLLYETGTDLSNFLLNLGASDLSGLAGQNLAGTGFREMGFFVSQDFQVYMLVPGVEPQNISLPLGNAIANAYTACLTPQVQLEVYNRDGNTWLIVNVADKSQSAINKQFVYDLNHNMWFPVWTKQMNVMAYGRLRDQDPLNYLIGFVNGGDGSWHLGVLDTTVFTDCISTNLIVPIIRTNLFSLAAGWGAHTSLINAPAVTPQVAYLVAERTKFTSDTDPTVSFRLDEFNIVPATDNPTFTTVSPSVPLFEPQHVSYWKQLYAIEQACHRVQLNITKPGVNEGFEYQNLGFIFQPAAGA